MSTSPKKNRPREESGDLFDALRFSEEEEEPTPSEALSPGPEVDRNEQKQPADEEENRMVPKPEPEYARPIHAPSATPPGAGPDEEMHIPVDFGDEDLRGVTLDLPDSFLPVPRKKLELPVRPEPRESSEEGQMRESSRHQVDASADYFPQKSISVMEVIFTCVIVQVLTFGLIYLLWDQGVINFSSPEGSAGFLQGKDSGEEVAEDMVPMSREERFAARLNILELEDRATSRGERAAWDALQQELESLSPGNPLHDAIMTSLGRVRRTLTMDRPEPEPLDPDLFPDTPESSFPTAQLQGVLADRRHPAPQRMRAAELLGERASTRSIVEALLKSMEEDPNLHVVAEAGQALKESTGYDGDTLDAAQARSWVKGKGMTARTP